MMDEVGVILGNSVAEIKIKIEDIDIDIGKIDGDNLAAAAVEVSKQGFGEFQRKSLSRKIQFTHFGESRNIKKAEKRSLTDYFLFVGVDLFGSPEKRIGC